ncbi:hypothetical protein K435DRAFT_864274 [Dendrothele bispora CBS 962.96]|uniref:Uncharacterized protein n=1 Tax=Dendrothele bispora (strain CBS 962.96) TaxID=1314807 RepID=A0A4S8LMH9_DENBC|nr:hypothetical protein K435DRAFT_864274 [Dendrothele bispora CBS 962.96]
MSFLPCHDHWHSCRHVYEIKECWTTTLLYFIQDYNPESRVPSLGKDCILARPDTYLEVSTSIPIQSPSPKKAFVTDQSLADWDCSDEYDLIARPQIRNPISAYCGTSSFDYRLPSFDQHPSQHSNTDSNCLNLTPLQNTMTHHSIDAIKGIQPEYKHSISPLDEGDETKPYIVNINTVPCSSQTLAAHYGAHSFCNQWPVVTDQTFDISPT